ncbi:putative sporulation protein YyaC [Paenibacillus sp. cl141a]|uniref:spore protease YyaC n=1 Tax=Paenibacillus sp. cl141a TaxID=1761877 RepID=UPI0008C7557F|nr:spore protease YyaC [Paenibacillus sp. cl141a]SEM44309.1 putative sporulation protein YyaC [Paenibacillus sp. cl141a]
MSEQAGKTPSVHAAKAKMSGHELADFFRGISQRHALGSIVFLCIGTDRSTGDALGPLTGSRLVECGFPQVIGTLPEPCDAFNLVAKLQGIPEDQVVIAIDACLGQSSSVGYFFAGEGPLTPAQSVGGKLPAVGDYSVAAVVNVHGPKPYWTLQVTSLYQVMGMAEQIAKQAAAAFGLWP